MLPDIVRPSGITKRTQVAFGGFDRRPEARDGTWYDTEHMTAARYPLLAARSPRTVYSEGFQGLALYGFGDVLLSVRDGGYVYYNNWLLCMLAEQDYEHRLIPFGKRVIVPVTRQILNLQFPLKGRVTDSEALPANPGEGDAWAVGVAENFGTVEVWVRESGSWVNKGPVLEDLEKEISGWAMIFRKGVYQGEAAEANTIEMNPNNWELPGVTSVPAFTDYFKVGDAVTISGCTGRPENNQTLIIREVTERELRFYENSFRNYIGRHTVGKDGLSAGNYECTGWFQADKGRGGEGDPKVYFTIPSGVSLTSGDYLEYFFDVSQPNPMHGFYDAAVINVYHADGTAYACSPLTPAETYSGAAPTKISFEEVDRDNMYHGELNVTISKKWPELDGVFADSNRLWGWDRNTIYASKLGDPSNFFFFDGTADSAWSVELQTAGPITGGVSVHGYPTFFKEHRRYRIYGSTPESYQLSEQDCHGVLAGCDRAMVVLDGALYYVSRIGVMMDSGSIPTLISQALGEIRLHNAVGCGAGTEVHFTGQDEDGSNQTFIYDTRSGIWLREGSHEISSYAAAGGKIFAAEWMGPAGQEYDYLVCYGTGPWSGFAAETPVLSRVVSNDWTNEEPNRKRIHRVQLRFTVAEGATLTISVKYDSTTAWRTVGTITGDGVKQSHYFPVMLRRCDHFALKLEGSGAWELESLALETRNGSAIH